MALTLHEASLCSGCGQPRSRAFHPDMGGFYEVEDFDCAGCEALVSDGKAQKGHSPARKVYLVDTGPPDDQLKVVDF